MRVAASDRSNGKKMRNIVRHSANLEFAFFTKARFCLRISRKEGWAFKTKICFCRERDTHKKHKYRQQNSKFILLQKQVQYLTQQTHSQQRFGEFPMIHCCICPQILQLKTCCPVISIKDYLYFGSRIWNDNKVFTCNRTVAIQQ